MQKWAVSHLISKRSLIINVIVFSLWIIINEFEKFGISVQMFYWFLTSYAPSPNLCICKSVLLLFLPVSDTKLNLSRVKREHSYHLTKLFPASYMLGLRESAQYGTDPGPSSLLGIFRIGEMIYWMRSKLACFPWESLLLSFVRALTKIILPSGACESVTFFFFQRSREQRECKYSGVLLLFRQERAWKTLNISI